LVLLGSFACGSKFRNYCEKRAQCRGGNEKDIEACVADKEGDNNQAKAYDCDDAAQKYAECLDQKAFCKNGSYDTSACATESQALSACVCAASATCKKSSSTITTSGSSSSSTGGGK
jgi:hypothetical protein